ncbi:MAG: MFS transporter [Tenericutes bacterium]|jgi:DHA3 family tetracycline resistance protein-like MFS transporter|nr:MFS transporter [Mycoplasmatota bacterium]
MKQSTMYYMIRGLLGLSFHMIFTAAGLYRIDIAHLEVYQLILIGTALEISIFIFEIPTGIIADLKSRRLSIIIGLFIIAFGAMIEVFTPFFYVIFISQLVLGFGYTFISGALDSWISDEIKPDALEHTIITGSQIYALLSILGIVLAAVIGVIDIRLSIYVGAFILIALGFLSIIYMKEDHFIKHKSDGSAAKQYFTQFIKGFAHIKNNKMLRIMFVIVLFYGLYSEGIDRTYELNILDGLNFRMLWDLPPIWILSIVNAIVAVIGYLMLFVVKRYLKKSHYLYLWAFNLTLMMIIGIVLFAYMPYVYFALFGFIFFSVSRAGTHPLLNTILLKNTPTNIKATVLSSFGQLDAIGQLLSGGLMVLISLWLDIKGVYLVTALLLIVPMMLFLRLKRIATNDSLDV